MQGTSNIPLMQRVADHGDRLAIIDKDAEYTCAELLSAANSVSLCLLDKEPDLNETRVVFMVRPCFEYAAVNLGIWQAGGISVPLCIFHPLPEIEYVIKDTSAEIIILHPDFEKSLRPLLKRLNIRIVLTSEILNSRLSNTNCSLPEINLESRAMILYTSGTTSRPKGVVSTHFNITAQIKTLVDAWGWSADDRILNVLPLHHTHGIINVLMCALWTGAVCEMMPGFDGQKVWDRFLSGGITLFMAVPTIYIKLMNLWDKAGLKEKEKMSKACTLMRLMVSGSAALPEVIFNKWKSISGHFLLERYGMTETGMILSNPLDGERRPGFVGRPFPGIKVKLVDESGNEIFKEDKSGEIMVSGPLLFKEYWEKPEATEKAFVNKWFLTGDIAVVERGYFKILGRDSVDIIKTGGYKVSALEIEAVLLENTSIDECAVVGIYNQEWGERVCAAVSLCAGCSFTLEELRFWTKKRLAPYKVPSRLLVVDKLPRNIMGKVVKAEVKKMLGQEVNPEI